MTESSLHTDEKENWHQFWKIRKAVQKSHKKFKKKSSRWDDEEWDDNKAESKEDRVKQKQIIHN